MKILLIDQDTNTLEMLQISLTRAGHTVLIAADGDAGLRLARTESPDLIALDVLLPGANGLELIHQLQDIPATRDIPRVIITALSLPNTQASAAFQSQPDNPLYDAYFSKPLSVRHFMQYIERHNVSSPAATNTRPVGPSILIISKDDALRNSMVELLREKQFNVYAYPQFMKPIEKIRNYPPSVLLVDEEFLSPSAWDAFSTLRDQNPVFNLGVITQSSSQMPDYLKKVDFVVNSPISSWELLKIMESLIDYRQAKTRADYLSDQILQLNSDLAEARNAFLAQKEELEFVNNRLHELSELKETLTGMVVHDLKAPLSAMVGALQFMTMDPGNTITEMSRKIMDGGIAAAGQMQRLTLTLLDEHKLENNQWVLEPEPVSLPELLDTSLSSLAPLFKMHHVDITTKLPEDLPDVMADPIMLQRIIENLLDNAVKYSPENESIAVIAEHERDSVKICVADHGDGIPPQHRKLIFERFAQLDTPADLGKVRNGIGLGLTFCKLAVQTMGGSIWVGDRAGYGAAFYFTLPASNGAN